VTRRVVGEAREVVKGDVEILGEFKEAVKGRGSFPGFILTP
jgi:hypothetical protein